MISTTEKGSVCIPFTFTDCDGETVTPTAAEYNVTDLAGNVINSQEVVGITPLASSVKVLLYGDDLEIESNRSIYYIITFSWTYNYGAEIGVTGVQDVRFLVRKMLGSGTVVVDGKLVFIDELGVEFIDALGLEFIDG